MRRKLTLSEAKINLQELKNDYIKQGIDLSDLKISHRNHEKASRFIRRNRNNPAHPNFHEFQILYDSTIQNYQRYRRIISFERKINSMVPGACNCSQNGNKYGHGLFLLPKRTQNQIC